MSPQIQDLDMQGYSILRLGAGMLSRTITGTTDQINVSNGDGVSGNPTLSFASAVTDELRTGWHKFDVGALTYSSASVFASSVDYTGVIGVGDKIWITQSGSKYFYVTAITASTITVTGGSDYTIANTLVSGPYWSHAATPIGFPQWFNYAPTYGGSGSLTFATVTTTAAKFMMVGKTVFFALDFTGTTGGSTSTDVTVSLPVTSANTFQCGAYADVSDGALISGTNRITSQMNIRRYDSINWGLGAGRLIHTAGFYLAS